MVPTDTLLLIAPGCPHCPGVLDSLTKLVKEGAIRRLEVVNVAVDPERALELGARGVPWVRIGPFEMEGALTPAELRRRVEQAGSDKGFEAYLEEILAEGGLARVERLMSRSPDHFARLLPLVERENLPMQVRIGIGALFEEFAGAPSLKALVKPLGLLARHADHRVRSDAAHLLGLTRNPDAVPILESILADDNPEVREIAQEALSELAQHSPK
jgi:thiol-disulfide isomerase/thioredoxin